MTRSKRFLTALLTTATMVTTIFVPAMASAEVSTPALTNLTAINSDSYELDAQAAYTKVVTEGEPDQFEFAVCGATDEWKKAYFPSKAEADKVSWKILPGSTSGVDIAKEADVEKVESYEVADDQWVSIATVDVTNAAVSGIAIVEAYYENNPSVYSDFTVLVDSAQATTAANIQNRFYNVSDNNALITSATCAQVNGDAVPGAVKFANPLDCFAALKTAGDIEDYVVAPNYNTYTLMSVTFAAPTGTLAAGSSYTDPGWQYRVYDSQGKIRPFSANVAADDFKLNDGDIVVWKYGTYMNTTFADEITPAL